MKQSFTFFVALFASIFFASTVHAGAGHDHGDAAPSASGLALPRFTSQSDMFEAVGVLGKDELVVFVDRTNSNEPVLNATVELESGSIKAVGKFETALGEYHFDGKPFQQTAVYPITLTIKAGNDTDLLSADLDVHGAELVAATANSMIPHKFRDHPIIVTAVLLAVGLLAVGSFVLARRKSRHELKGRGAV